ncbi:hypothetical protein GP486_002634, partial [Trichoglossum hirsutum]
MLPFDRASAGTLPPHSHTPVPDPSPVAAAAAAAAGHLNPAALHPPPLAGPGLRPFPPVANAGRPQLSKEEQEAMFSTLEAIFQRAEEVEGGVGVSELRALSTDADEEFRTSGRRNVEALRDVRRILDQMWWSDSEFMAKAAE